MTSQAVADEQTSQDVALKFRTTVRIDGRLTVFGELRRWSAPDDPARALVRRLVATGAAEVVGDWPAWWAPKRVTLKTRRAAVVPGGGFVTPGTIFEVECETPAQRQ